MNKRTILLTGCAGFIGEHFLQYLLQTYPSDHIIGLDLLRYPALDWKAPKCPNFTFYKGDICNEELLDTLVSQSDYIVHFAAETHVPRSIDDGFSFFRTNVMGTQVLTDLIAKHQKTVKRYLYISTSEVYGDAKTEQMKEDHPLQPHTPYAAAKAGADRLVSAYRISHGIPSTIIRPFNNYGPGQHLEKAIPRFISHCLKGDPIEIHGSGSASRDWLFVKDHCKALDLVMQCPELIGETVNIGTEKHTSIKEIAEFILQLVDKEVPIQLVEDRPGQVMRHTADCSKINSILNWHPETTLERGLQMTVNWYLENRSRWEHQWEDRLASISAKSGNARWY